MAVYLFATLGVWERREAWASGLATELYDVRFAGGV